MTSGHEEKLPLSGYAILKVYSTKMVLEPKDPAEDVADHDALQFGWDWRWLNDGAFEVRITVGIEPSTARHQFAMVSVVGRFRQMGDPVVGALIDQFVRLQAVAILLPYARQFLSSLTANSLHGVYYLPTINVEALMNGYDQGNTTAAQQMAKRREVEKTTAAPTKTAKGGPGRRALHKKK